VTPEQRRGRGFRAKAALADGALKDAFDECADDIKTAWERALWPRTRERLHAELKGLQRVREKLAAMAAQAPRD